MSFNTSPGRAEYTAAAAQTLFTFTFKIYDTSDIKVYLTPAGDTPDDTADLLTETTDYSVSINGDNGGTVTLVTGATLNDSITLLRVLPVDRDVEYQQNGDLTAATLNEDQDYQTYLILDGALSINSRTMILQESVQGVSSEMPIPQEYAFLQWATDGTHLQNQTSFTQDGILWTASDVYLKSETYSQAEVDAADALNLSLTGGTLTGQAKGITPVAAADLTRKDYIDTHPGVSHASVIFVGATAAISGSNNIASVTRTSAGFYTIVFTSALSSANLLVQVTVEEAAPAGAKWSMSYSTPLTTGVAVITESNGVASDPLAISVTVTAL